MKNNRQNPKPVLSGVGTALARTVPGWALRQRLWRLVSLAPAAITLILAAPQILTAIPAQAGHGTGTCTTPSGKNVPCSHRSGGGGGGGSGYTPPTRRYDPSAERRARALRINDRAVDLPQTPEGDKQALRLFNQACQLGLPKGCRNARYITAAILNRYGNLEYERRRNASAARYYRKAISNCPNDPRGRRLCRVIRKNLAGALRGTGGQRSSQRRAGAPRTYSPRRRAQITCGVCEAKLKQSIRNRIGGANKHMLPQYVDAALAGFLNCEQATRSRSCYRGKIMVRTIDSACMNYRRGRLQPRAYETCIKHAVR